LNILAIRACAIGDFVLNLPALAALQEYHSTAAFTLVGYPSTLELAREFVNVATIHSIDVEPWNRLFSEPLRSLKFDLAIVWMKDGTVAENLRKSGIGNVVQADPFSTLTHAAAHLLETIRMPRPELPDRWHPVSDYFVIHPGSGSPKKCWPYFLNLADRLGRAEFLLGPVEAGFQTGRYPRMEHVSLRDVCKILSSIRGYVGNDSGITHLAAYLGVPTVALFGPTDPKLWCPCGRRVRVLHSPQLEDISVESVVAALSDPWNS